MVAILQLQHNIRITNQFQKDLNEHIESVHKGEQKLKCKICHISFELKIELNQHISSVHDGCITMVNNETLNHEKTVIIDNDLSPHNDGMIMCHGCEIPATHFCKSCNQNLCKFCIIYITISNSMSVCTSGVAASLRRRVPPPPRRG